MNYELISKIREQAPRFIAWAVSGLDKLKVADFIMPLLIRLYLAPVMWMAGANKFSGFSNTVEWFGNEEWGLGLPLPYLLVFLVASAEILGAILLFFGAGVRLISVPLMAIMLVAALTVHWKNGWLAIATGDGLFATERTVGAIERLEFYKITVITRG